MYALKIITSVLIAIMIVIVSAELISIRWEPKNKATIFGFTFMEIVYVLSIVCIWY